MHATFLIFRESYKIIKTATLIVCFSVLSISSAFTISTYFINEGTWKKFQKKNYRCISGTCTNNGSKIKSSTHRGHITFAWIWRLTGITFARRKSITIARKMYPRLFFAFARIICYLEYI
jgi:hypothetical protein